MARKHHKPEEIVAKLRQVEVLLAQGKTTAEAVRTIGVTEQSYYRWRSEYGGLKLDQAQRFLSAHGVIYGHFRPRRHLMSAGEYRHARDNAFRLWKRETCVQVAA